MQAPRYPNRYTPPGRPVTPVPWAELVVVALFVGAVAALLAVAP